MDQAMLLRKMTGKQRLMQAIKLSELVRKLSELGKTDMKKLYETGARSTRYPSGNRNIIS